MNNQLLRIHPKDNVAVALSSLTAGTTVDGLNIVNTVPCFHKVALTTIPAGAPVVKYGSPIGTASFPIQQGEWVHTHNLVTNLNEEPQYTFSGDYPYTPFDEGLTIQAYRRTDGRIGIRNELWIIPTVGCVNRTAEKLAVLGRELAGETVDNVTAMTHPYGCSQMGDDHGNTQKLLAALVKHPNAGGILLVSLGCENNHLKEFLPLLGEYDTDRVKTLVCQDCEDELAEGKQLLTELLAVMQKDRRETLAANRLVIGMKCGGSDAMSGITSNPLCGKIADRHTASGGAVVLTEVPEMFGAEQLLLRRCVSHDVFERAVSLLESYKQYFAAHGEVCYENPSPGNHDGGITTLEEKSLGCIQKGGSSAVTDVLSYASPVKEAGLSLLWGPGNDIVSATNLMAAGAHLVLFTTGRGTPLGTFVPTIKLSTHTALAVHKCSWIDFDAGAVLSDGFDGAAEALYQTVLAVAEGKKTNNERNDYRQLAIFKDGVTM